MNSAEPGVTPTHQTFRTDLDRWMMEEPQLNYTDLKNLANDIGDLDPQLRQTFITALKDSHLKDIAQLFFP